jgi:hypothetical protein
MKSGILLRMDPVNQCIGFCTSTYIIAPVDMMVTVLKSVIRQYGKTNTLFSRLGAYMSKIA